MISLTFGILKGEAPDAAASAGRFVSFALEAFESENLLMAPNPCFVGGQGGASERYKTSRSNERLRGTYVLTCAMKTLTLVVLHIVPTRSLADQKH